MPFKPFFGIKTFFLIFNRFLIFSRFFLFKRYLYYSDMISKFSAPTYPISESFTKIGRFLRIIHAVWVILNLRWDYVTYTCTKLTHVHVSSKFKTKNYLLREKLLNSVSFVKWVISEWLMGIFSEDSLNFGTILAGVGRFIRTGADRLTIVDKWCRDDRIVAIEAPRCVWILKNLIIIYIYIYHIIKYVKIFQKWIF